MAIREYVLEFLKEQLQQKEKECEELKKQIEDFEKGFKK